MGNYDEYLEDALTKIKTTLYDSGTRPILFIGSGFSRRYINAPTWENLLKKMIEFNSKIEMPIGYYLQQTNNNYPNIASLLIDDYQKFAWENKDEGTFPTELFDGHYGKSIFLKFKIAEYLMQLDESFDIEKHTLKKELIELSKLNPHAIITTNYDNLLDKLFPNFKVIVGQQVIKQKNSTSIGHILKIHGSTNDFNEIVISQEDYDKFNEKQKYLSAKLLTYFMEHPIFFFGYSITDENIKNILADISEIVVGDSDQIIENIWFIEWKEEKIDNLFSPPRDKTIDLGQGKSIRINYLLVNSFNDVFTSLYQPSLVEINELRDLQENIYNIVKSKTVSNLEVDVVSIQNVNSIESIEQFMGIEKADDYEGKTVQLLGLSTISDPEQIITIYPMRLSEVAEKLDYSYWYPVDQLIKQVKEKTSYDLKETNNIYHIDVGIKQPQHRYSSAMVDLLKQVKNGEEYQVNI
ncbi:SIR2 family protein [Listeria seeligeri]|uniref:SIR2 family protein n=1 Tax=Listeria seeligeri TaxID=1640 RepID=UPI0010D3C097|nr:SIR2 family protein [Listeria seeligeri]MBC1878881.1 hypothetical protein [Listeria seeligeri]MBC1914936.1 hypothetical protein [Listeria seeligeri]MBC2245981.1 hypothetical protein [Listeria seeligeri]MBF2375748.1 SIR2 family protein [Listeria seeligeri]MBF2400412.1 SIR2 family protein [Listeria seeligeri]